MKRTLCYLIICQQLPEIFTSLLYTTLPTNLPAKHSMHQLEINYLDMELYKPVIHRRKKKPDQWPKEFKMNVSTTCCSLPQHFLSPHVLFPFGILPVHLPLQDFNSTQRKVGVMKTLPRDNDILSRAGTDTFLKELLLPHFHDNLSDSPFDFHIILRN